jgi:glycosyltransferase involved in cell wall biosynthesis
MQAEKLASLLTDAGYPVVAFSSQLNPYLRLADIVVSLLRYGQRIDVTLIEIYAGRSFLVEDIASFLAKLLGHRVIMTLHGGALPEFTSRHPRWARTVFDRADALVAPSPFLARMAIQQGRAVQIIPNVVDLSAYPYRHRSEVRPTLWWMRSFHDIYNPHMAVKVLAHLRARGHEATLVMSGSDKGLEADVKSRAAEMGLSHHVRFAGFLDMTAKAREGSLADIFINTNRIDNSPVAVIEACAMGLPVVATSVGGVPDLLADGDTGLLVADDDDVAMADAVERLVNEPDLAARLSANGRRLAERSSWQAVGPQWERLLGGRAA